MPWFTLSLPTNSVAEITAAIISFKRLAPAGCRLTSKTNVQGLEGPAKEGQVAASEDRNNQRSVGNRSGTRVFPLKEVNMNLEDFKPDNAWTYAQQIVEERMVIYMDASVNQLAETYWFTDVSEVDRSQLARSAVCGNQQDCGTPQWSSHAGP